MVRGSRACTLFYRVVDDDSQSNTVTWHGLLAGRETRSNFFRPGDFHEKQELKTELEDHEVWGNREATAFISVYDDKNAAFHEAFRRVGRGKSGVTVFFIDTGAARERGCKMEYRQVLPLVEKLGAEVPERAMHNCLHEWVFLNNIPTQAIVKFWEYDGY